MINNLAFGTNIRLISQRQYCDIMCDDSDLKTTEVPDPAVEVPSYRDIKNGDDAYYKVKDAKTDRKLFTKDAYDCSVVAVTNQKEFFLSHLSPNYSIKNKHEHEDKFSKLGSKENLNADKKELNGVITGGDARSKTSNDLYQNITKSLSSAVNDVSVIWGKKNSTSPATNVIAYGDKDAITGYEDTVLITWKPNKAKNNTTADDIEKYFQEVHIGKDDHLFIGTGENALEITEKDHPEFFQTLEVKNDK